MEMKAKIFILLQDIWSCHFDMQCQSFSTKDIYEAQISRAPSVKYQIVIRQFLLKKSLLSNYFSYFKNDMEF